MALVSWIADGLEELGIAPGSADVFGRTAALGVDQAGIGKPRCWIADALDLDRMFPAIAEVVELFEGLGAGVLDQLEQVRSRLERAVTTQAPAALRWSPADVATISHRCELVQPIVACRTRCSRSSRRLSGTSRRRMTAGLTSSSVTLRRTIASVLMRPEPMSLPTLSTARATARRSVWPCSLYHHRDGQAERPRSGSLSCGYPGPHRRSSATRSYRHHR